VDDIDVDHLVEMLKRKIQIQSLSNNYVNSLEYIVDLTML
jgi:hypothetical protein